MRLSLTYILLFFISYGAIAQSKEIAALRHDLSHARDSFAYVDMLNQLGMYYHLSNTDSCFWFAKKAREIARRLNYRKGEAGALKNLGIVYSQKLNLPQAIAYEQEALQLYRETGDSANACHIMNNLSIDYEESGNTAMEHYYLHQAMMLGSQLSNDSMFSLVLSNYILEYYADSSRQDSVGWAHQRLHAITARYPYSREWFYARMFDGVVMLKEGQGAAGEALINRVADTAMQKGFRHLAIAAYYRILDNFIPMGYKADSIAYVEKIFRLSQKAGYYDVMMNTLPALYRHYSALKDANKTALYGQAVSELARHQLALRKGRQEINYMDYFLKEQELKSLQLGNRVQQQAIEQSNMERANRRLLILLLGGLLLLVAIIIIVYYRSYRSSRQYERRLAAMNYSISEKNKLLRANDDFKNKLISVVAHDFRNPLENIIRMAVLMQTHSLDRNEMLRIIDQVQAASGKTLDIFESILRWIKSQLSGFVYAPSPCYIRDMMQEALLSVQHAAQQKRITVRIDVPENVQVAAEREMLQFVHRSLLNSAVQFSMPGNQVTVSSAGEDGIVKVSVKAERTAPDEMRLPLFVYRGRDHKHGDAELTLIICKDFMDKMGGHIGASPEGEGLVFEYGLPAFH
jgi:signal transduction histidine kinase